MRTSEKKRKTAATDITLTLNLDGSGQSEIQTDCGFLNHMLFIKVKNQFAGNLKKKNGEFLSTKDNDKLRGVGLRSVHSAVGLYDGTMDIDTEDGFFTVNVLLYNQSNTSPASWQ